MLGEQIIDVSASELIEKGVLAQPIIKFFPVPKMNMHNANYQSAYKQYIVENDERNEIIVNQVKVLIEKKYTVLALYKNIKHGNILYDMMKEEGIKCELLSGTDSLERRNEVKEMINNKDINVVICSVIFDIGVDLPILSALVLCGGGKSKIRLTQRAGRVCRKYPGKKHCVIVEFYDNCRYLKGHSMKRYEGYCEEKGFKVIPCKEMKIAINKKK